MFVSQNMEVLSTSAPAYVNFMCLSKKTFTANHSVKPSSLVFSHESATTKTYHLRKLKQSGSRISAVSDEFAVVSSDPAQVEITWEIVVGALAGVMPFVVAGIEFSKRIVKQRKCEVCGGSGLVLRDKKYYFRCPRCGGFLPWQSWRRFFTG